MERLDEPLAERAAREQAPVPAVVGGLGVEHGGPRVENGAEGGERVTAGTADCLRQRVGRDGAEGERRHAVRPTERGGGLGGKQTRHRPVVSEARPRAAVAPRQEGLEPGLGVGEGRETDAADTAEVRSSNVGAGVVRVGLGASREERFQRARLSSPTPRVRLVVGDEYLQPDGLFDEDLDHVHASENRRRPCGVPVPPPSLLCMKAIQSALTWAAIVGLVLFALPVMLVTRLFDRTPARLRTGRAFRVIGSWIPSVNPAWRVEVGGIDPAALGHPYVIVSNHQSLADIPVISKLPWEMKWVGKKELFDIPVMGWLMKLAADIPVDRKDPASRATVLLRAQRVLDQGCSVMFFPEGTRSKDGRVKRFHDGAFRLAIEAGVPVLPLAVDGTMDAIPKHGWQFGRADIRLDVLPPVPTDGLTEADLPELRDRVRQMIVEHMAAWRELPAESVDALNAAPLAPAVVVEDRSKSTPRPIRTADGG